MAQILPFEHWCADGCGEILEQRGGVTRVRRWKIVLESGKIVGKLFTTEQDAKDWLAAHGK